MDAANASELKPSHTGYDKLGGRHIRSFIPQSDGLQILDVVAPLHNSQAKAFTAKASFHFHPKVTILSTLSMKLKPTQEPCYLKAPTI
ncbi:MAG: heparinase II/III family protein [Lewinellaceae bacterium]|nr:heparinase II/III family protein [Lewinellaceae bacterium]